MAPRFEPKRATIDPELLARLYALYASDPVIKACASKLTESLFNGGISIMLGEEEASPTDAFQRLIDEAWLPFAREAVDRMRAWGFVPWVVLRGEGRADADRDPYPAVPPIGTFRIAVETDRFRSRLVALDEEDKAMEEVRFFVVSMPAPDGAVRSKVASLLALTDFQEELLDAATAAERMNGRPLMVTQTRPDNSTVAQGLQFDIFADGDRFAAQDGESGEGGRFARDARAIEALRRQTELAAQINAATAGRLARPARPAGLFALPSDQQLASQTLARPRPDLGDLLRLRQEVVCGVVGVPRALAFSDGVAQNALAGLVRIMHATISSEQRDIARCLEEAYRAIYAAADAEAALKRKRDRASAGDLRVRVRVHSTPHATIEEIIAVAERGGLLPHEERERLRRYV